MAVIETIRPQSKALTTLARVWSELKITTPDAERDANINSAILEASALIMKEIGYPLFRARITETLVGVGRSELLLSRTPVVRVNSVTMNGQPLASGEFSADPDIGVLLHDTAWPNTRHRGAFLEPYERPDEGRHAVSVDYWAGALGPADNVNASGIAVDGPTSSFVFDTPPLLVPGDVIETSGFLNDENNDTFTVAGRNATRIEVEGTLVSETAPDGAQILVRTLDQGLERLCVQTIKSWILGADTNPAVTSERIGDWSASYGTGNKDLAHELPPGVFKGLDKYRRYA